MAEAAQGGAPPAPPTAPPPPPSPSPLLALPDHLLRFLLRRLDPRPDLFAAARTCKRLRSVVGGPRAYLVVSPPSSAAAATTTAPASAAAAAFPDLASAVAASRPGDTIWLSPTEPGPAHEAPATGIRVSHPLQILGGGRVPSDTRVECASAAAPAVLDFAAPHGRVANVTLSHRAQGGGGGAAVLHRSGTLRLERCRLEGARHALPSRSAPLVSVASASAEAEGVEGQQEKQQQHSKQQQAADPPARHVVTVAETELVVASGGGGGGRSSGVGRQGVRALGTGAVAGVRAVFGAAGGGGGAARGGGQGAAAVHYWLEVDASRPGRAAPGADGAAAALLAVGDAPAPAACRSAGALAQQQQQLQRRHPLAPQAWRGHGPDDPLARINALLGKRGRGGGGGGLSAVQAAQAADPPAQRPCCRQPAAG